MLADKIILYDDNCPMCKVYTQGFVSMGILTSEHRMGMTHAPADIMNRLELKRARHEIPLLDAQTGEVTYGMETLFLLIQHRFPVFAPFFRSLRFRTLVYALYQLITYNRRVIVGCAAPREGFDCAPDFSRPVRVRYLRLALATWGLLTAGAAIAAAHAAQFAPTLLLLAVAGLQLLYFAHILRTRCFWDKAGSFATNYLLFGVLLSPSLLPLPGWARWSNLALAISLTALDAVRRNRNCRRCLSSRSLCREVHGK